MRKIKIITVPGEPSSEPGSRDNGKKFLVREMASRPAEKWAARAFLALAHSHVDLPAGIGRDLRSAKGSMAQIYSLATLVGHLSFPELEPLMDELMRCVSFVVDDRANPPLTRAIHDDGDDNDDIQEVQTRHFIRAEVIDVHVGFSLPAAILNLIAVGSTMTEISTSSSSITPTSRRQSRR